MVPVPVVLTGKGRGFWYILWDASEALGLLVCVSGQPLIKPAFFLLRYIPVYHREREDNGGRLNEGESIQLLDVRA